MRVLYLSPCGHLGGAERVLLDVLASLRQAEPEWTLGLISGEDGELLAAARNLGVAVRVLPFPELLAGLGDSGASRFALAARSMATLPALARYGARLSRAIGEFAPDLIHTNGFKMHLLGAWAGAGSAPVIWHLHDFLRSRAFVAQALRFSAFRCRTVVAISEAVAEDARMVLAGIPVRVMSNAVDLARYRPEGPSLDLDALSGLPAAPAGTVRVGLVGTFARWKGHAIFLEAIAQLAKRELPFRAYVIGGPIYRTCGSQHSLHDLQSLARRLAIADRVGFTGFQPDTPGAMRALDLVVHASTAPEPFGLVIAEAMACGRPVVACPSGGAAEIFRAEHDALGVGPCDPVALSAAIARLIQSPELRARLGAAARATAEARLDRSRYPRVLIPYYREALSPCDYSTSTAEISSAA